MSHKIVVLALVVVLGAAVAASHHESLPLGDSARSASESSSLPTEPTSLRSQRAAAVLGSGDALLVHSGGTHADALRRAYMSLFGSITGANGELASPRIVSADEVSSDELRHHPLILIGSPKSNPWVADALERFPVHVGELTLRLFDEEARFGRAMSRFANSAPYANLVLYGVNPHNPDHGMILFTAADDPPLVRYRFNLDIDGDYLLRLRDIKMRWGRFSDDAGPLTPDPSVDRNLAVKGTPNDYELDKSIMKLTRESSSGRTRDDDIYSISYPSELPRKNNILGVMRRRAEALREAIARITGNNNAEPRLAMYLYGDRQSKAEITGDFSYSHSSSIGEQVHSLFDENFSPRDITAELEIARGDLFPRLRLLAIKEGFAPSISDHWRGRRIGRRSSNLLLSEHLPQLVQLLDNTAYTRLSPLVRVPAGAALCQFVMRNWDDPAAEDDEENQRSLAMLMALGHAQVEPAAAVQAIFEMSIEEFDLQWRNWILSTYGKRDVDQRDSRPKESRAWYSNRATPSSMQAGIELAHSYRLETGIGSRGVTGVLEQIRGAGADWVSLRPKVTLQAADHPVLVDFPERPGSFASGTPDGALEETLNQAEQLGLHVALAPTLVVPGGSAPAMSTHEDWQRFFQSYGAMMAHHAILADEHDVDMLVIGCGIHGESLRRMPNWSALIQELRKLYSGAIIFAASSIEDAGNAHFWGSLDAIGVDLVLPSIEPGQDAEAVYGQAVRALSVSSQRLSRRYQKPVVLTQVRHAEPVSDQQRSKATSVYTTILIRHPWFGGAYWGRLYSDPRMNQRPVFGQAPWGDATRDALKRAFKEFR